MDPESHRLTELNALLEIEERNRADSIDPHGDLRLELIHAELDRVERAIAELRVPRPA